MKKRIISTLLALGMSISVYAVEIEGVEVPETAMVAGQELVLNGAGVRKKAWVEVYVGALYLSDQTGSAVDAVAATDAKRITLDMLYAVSSKKLVKAWNEGFEDNTDADTLATLTDKIETFNGYFADTVVGDRIVIDIAPNSGTSVTINDVTKGTITGDDFAAAVLNIWLGGKPPTENLKAAMLGG